MGAIRRNHRGETSRVKRTKKGEDPSYIKWSRILQGISKAARVSLVLDLSATPWYGSGSPKPEGTLYEWLVSDFSVYDAGVWPAITFHCALQKLKRSPAIPPFRGNNLWLDNLRQSTGLLGDPVPSCCADRSTLDPSALQERARCGLSPTAGTTHNRGNAA